MTDLPGIILLGLRFGLALCLYLFLFWSVKMIWRDLGSNTSKRNLLIPQLVLTFTGDQDFVNPIILSETEYLLGRGSECTININNSTVSSLHARIFHAQSQWWIEDLNSSNGTFLNGIEIHQPAVLTSKDELGFGSLEAVVEIHSPNK